MAGRIVDMTLPRIHRLLIYIFLGPWLFANVLYGGRLVVILHSGATGWQLQDADKVLVNGKAKIRIGAAGMTNVEPDQYRKLAVEPIGNTSLRMHRAGYLAYRLGSSWVPVLPDGVNLKSAMTPATLWAQVGVEVQGEKGAKSSNVNSLEVFAILPGVDAGEAAVDFIADESNFTGVGENDAASAFDERMSLLVAVSGNASTGATAKLKGMLLTAMNAAIQKTEGGTARYADIQQGLKFVDVSARAFSGDPLQKEARDKLLGKKQWVGQRVAILHALNAGDEHDAFIEKYGDFELYDNSFPELRVMREESFKASAAYHIAASDRFLADKQYEPALAELNLARLRSPADKSIPDKIQEIRDESARHSHKAKPPDLNSPVQIEITRLLARADHYSREGKWAEAQHEIELADAKDKNSYRILLQRTKLFQNHKQYHQALDALDRYDRLVSEPQDSAAGETLREEINLELTSTKETLSGNIKKAEELGDYTAALSAAKQALEIDSEDPFFLYHSGVIAAIRRDGQQSLDLLKRYLAVSQSNPAESTTRSAVLNLLPLVEDPPPAPAGTPNWFSGYNMSPGLFYCPLSLMISAHPVEVKGSRNESSRYFWSDGRLMSVSTVAQKPESSNVTVYFEYFAGGKGVRRVSTEPFTKGAPDEALNFTAQGTVGSGNGTYVTLFNNPTISPYMVEKLTGKRVGVIVAGNPYFHPFVWNGVHAFLAEYDNQGRVVSAKPLESKSSDQPLQFAWDGYRLMSVSSSTYKREIQYADGRISREAIQANGKNSKIEYKYKGDQLVEAACDPDPIDGRSRKVTFE